MEIKWRTRSLDHMPCHGTNISLGIFVYPSGLHVTQDARLRLVTKPNVDQAFYDFFSLKSRRKRDWKSDASVQRAGDAVDPEKPRRQHSAFREVW